MFAKLKQNFFTSVVGVMFMALMAAYLAAPTFVQAAGHITYRNVAAYLRTPYVEYPLYVLDVASGNTTDMTAGTDGVLAVTTINAVAAPTITSFKPTPYPCKVDIAIKEATAGGTLACTGDVVLVGYDQFGNRKTETITTDLAEVQTSIVTSSRVYGRLESFATSGCSGGAEANDRIRISCSHWVGLPMPVESVSGVLAVCAYDQTGPSTACYTSTDLMTGETDIDITDGDYAVNGDGLIGETPASWGGTLADGDRIQIRVRPPNGL